MNVVVEEKRTGELSFGAGFSTVDQLVGRLHLRREILTSRTSRVFTGGGQKFR